MPIICFEGASAVGKTTTANAFRSRVGASVVPEVHELYVRPADETPEWYFERQAERWRMAQEQSGSRRLVVLDGDPFQPLWYNWAYNFDGWQGLDFMERFYRPRVQNGTMRFPDLYVIFSTSESELRARREMDASRRRRGFETHLRMIEPQRRYFSAMRAIAPHRVLFMEAKAIESNVEFIRENVSALEEQDEQSSAMLFDRMMEWLRCNTAQS